LKRSGTLFKEGFFFLTWARTLSSTAGSASSGLLASHRRGRAGVLLIAAGPRRGDRHRPVRALGDRGLRCHATLNGIFQTAALTATPRVKRDHSGSTSSRCRARVPARQGAQTGQLIRAARRRPAIHPRLAGSRLVSRAVGPSSHRSAIASAASRARRDDRRNHRTRRPVGPGARDAPGRTEGLRPGAVELRFRGDLPCRREDDRRGSRASAVRMRVDVGRCAAPLANSCTAPISSTPRVAGRSGMSAPCFEHVASRQGSSPSWAADVDGSRLGRWRVRACLRGGTGNWPECTDEHAQRGGGRGRCSDGRGVRQSEEQRVPGPARAPTAIAGPGMGAGTARPVADVLGALARRKTRV